VSRSGLKRHLVTVQLRDDDPHKNELKPAGQAAACQAEPPETLFRVHHPQDRKLHRPSAPFAPEEKAVHVTLDSAGEGRDASDVLPQNE